MFRRSIDCTPSPTATADAEVSRFRRIVGSKTAAVTLAFAAMASIPTIAESTPVTDSVANTVSVGLLGSSEASADVGVAFCDNKAENYTGGVSYQSDYYLPLYFSSIEEAYWHSQRLTPEFDEFFFRTLTIVDGDDPEQEPMVLYGLKSTVFPWNKNNRVHKLVYDDSGKLISTILIDMPSECDNVDEDYPFDDVSSKSFAYTAIDEIANLGITTGTSPRKYSPEQYVTREQMAAFLARTYGALGGAEVDVSMVERFTDVLPNSFAYDDVSLLRGLGVTVGTSPTEYSPEQYVTREQMAAFLSRLYKELGGTVVAEGGESPFIDINPQSFAYGDIAILYVLGITNGTSYNKYSPDDNVTREQMAAFLYRLIEELTDIETLALAS